MTEGIITKFCGKCSRNLPASEFNKCNRSRDGLQSKCRACARAYNEANREKRKANYLANREKRKEQERARYWANREERLEKQKVYRKGNPEVCKAIHHRRRARKRNAEGDHNSAQAQARTAVHGDSCIYCASPNDLHLDHIKPLNKGGSNWPANLAPACAKCNLSKKDKWGEDLLRWIEQNCTVERTRKILGFVLYRAE